MHFNSKAILNSHKKRYFFVILCKILRGSDEKENIICITGDQTIFTRDRNIKNMQNTTTDYTG